MRRGEINKFIAGYLILTLAGCSFAGNPGKRTQEDISPERLKQFSEYDFLRKTKSSTEDTKKKKSENKGSSTHTETFNNPPLTEKPTVEKFCGDNVHLAGELSLTGEVRFQRDAIARIPGHEDQTSSEIDETMQERGFDKLKLDVSNQTVLCISGTSSGPTLTGALQDGESYYLIDPTSEIQYSNNQYNIHVITKRKLPYEEIPQSILDLKDADKVLSRDDAYVKTIEHTFSVGESKSEKQTTGKISMGVAGSDLLDLFLPKDSILGNSAILYTLEKTSAETVSSTPVKPEEPLVPTKPTKPTKLPTKVSTTVDIIKLERSIKNWNYQTIKKGEFHAEPPVSETTIHSRCKGKTLVKFPLIASITPAAISAAVQDSLQSRIKSNLPSRAPDKAFEKADKIAQDELKKTRNYYIYAMLCWSPNETKEVWGAICTTEKDPKRCFSEKITYTSAPVWIPFVEISLSKDGADELPSYSLEATAQRAQQKKNIDIGIRTFLMNDVEKETTEFRHQLSLKSGKLFIHSNPEGKLEVEYKGQLITEYKEVPNPLWALTRTGTHKQGLLSETKDYQKGWMIINY